MYAQKYVVQKKTNEVLRGESLKKTGSARLAAKSHTTDPFFSYFFCAVAHGPTAFMT
jgi:hypothetical protein